MLRRKMEQVAYYRKRTTQVFPFNIFHFSPCADLVRFFYRQRTFNFELNQNLKLMELDVEHFQGNKTSQTSKNKF